MRSLCLFSFCAAAALLAGCQTGDVKAVVPIAGGGQITVPLTGKGPAPGEAEGYKMASAYLKPGQATREAAYEFVIDAAKPAAKRIRIEDISDESAVPLVDDTNPQFVQGHWTGKSETLTADDARLRWVMQIPPALRVYRVSITASDGHAISFNHVTSYPPFHKQAIRANWGEKY